MEEDKLAQIRLFVLDMDGTFYLGDRLLPGALQCLALLERRGTAFLFLTNNSSRTKSEYADKLRLLGLDLSDDRILTSGEATVLYLARERPDARIHLVGTPSLEKEFKMHGFHLVDEDPELVVLGFDTTVTYAKLWRLCNLVRSGLPYIATHPDINCPIDKSVMPDIGAIIAFVAASTGRRPDVIVGKPYLPIVEALVEKTGVSVADIAVVGDRLYTDMALGATGITTILLLSGETGPEDLEKSEIKPDYVMQDLAALAGVLENFPLVE